LGGCEAARGRKADTCKYSNFTHETLPCQQSAVAIKQLNSSKNLVEYYYSPVSSLMSRFDLKVLKSIIQKSVMSLAFANYRLSRRTAAINKTASFGMLCRAVLAATGLHGPRGAWLG
jgi:hypothetical protein